MQREADIFSFARCGSPCGYSGEAVFYAGSINKELAKNFAINNNKKILEMTPGGEWLYTQNIYSKLTLEEATKVWDIMSLRYAQGSSGSINAFVEGVSSTSTYTRVELGALDKNLLVKEVVTR